MLALVVAGCTETAPLAQDAAVDAAIAVACDGALCRTDNGGSCSAGAGAPTTLVGMLVAVVFVAHRRGRRP
jgi:MYXO-CTERM domain-containing protein